MVVFLKAKAYNLKEQFYTIVHFYSNPRFACADLLVGLTSLFYNPYRTCRKFLQKRGEENVYTYGETPLRTFRSLADAARLSKDDLYLELGSGRGKTLFFAHFFYGASAIGIDWVPQFVFLPNLIARICRIDVKCEKESYFETDLSIATVLYLYAIHLTDDELDRFKPQFEKMKSGARAILIGHAIDLPTFRLIETLPVQFAWGSTDAYIFKKIEPFI